MRPAASCYGLPFVAFTRVTDFDRLAFAGVPPLGDFLAMRGSKVFLEREKFEESNDDFHDVFMRSSGLGSAQDEAEAHVREFGAACPSSLLRSRFGAT